MRNVVLTATVAIALAAVPAFAKGQKAQKNAGAKQMTDQTFVTKTAAGGMAEVELGKLAQEKGTSDQVKSFAQRMVTDHNKANDELKTLAQNKNITLPTDIDPHDKALRDRLSKLSGAQFDHAYMQDREGSRHQGVCIEDAPDDRRAPEARGGHEQGGRHLGDDDQTGETAQEIAGTGGRTHGSAPTCFVAPSSVSAPTARVLSRLPAHAPSARGPRRGRPGARVRRLCSGRD
ncbi:MAG: hypothetical protein DMG00_25515 [Acidobacteria bacterium]|nr:MAG: hypothetical protein DMG00_25515 [Acidobacteriota bacterium]